MCRCLQNWIGLCRRVALLHLCAAHVALLILSLKKRKRKIQTKKEDRGSDKSFDEEAWQWLGLWLAFAVVARCNEDRPNYLSRQSSPSKQDTNYGLNTALVWFSVMLQGWGSLSANYANRQTQPQRHTHTHSHLRLSACSCDAPFYWHFNPKAEIMQHALHLWPLPICLAHHPLHHCYLSTPPLPMSLECCC